MFGNLLGTNARPIGKLQCHVIEGKEMPSMDIGGKSDCFVGVTIGKFSHKSKVIKSSLTPIWNEKFDVDIASMNETIVFSVYDWDQLSRNDLIGKVEFKLSNLRQGKNDLWLALPQINNKFPQIHVVLQIQPKIVVTVIAAKDLPAMDIGGKSDPFVELVLQHNRKKTNVKKGTINPTWNETFEFDVYDISQPLYVNVFRLGCVVKE